MHGLGSFLWGALSDRFGTRAVLLSGGVLLGLGLVAASQAATLLQFQLLFGIMVGLAAGSFYAPLIATATRWFTRHRSLAVALVSAGLGLGSVPIAPLSRWLITIYDWRIAMVTLGGLAWLRDHSRRAVRARRPRWRAPPVRRQTSGSADTTSPWRTRSHAAIRRHRVHPFRVLRGAFRARSSTWSATRSIAA